MTELIVCVRVTDKTGAVIDAYSIDHNSPEERQMLGIDCRRHFEAGHKVETWPATMAEG